MKRLLLAAGLSLSLILPAFAYVEYTLATNERVPGSMNLWWNGTNAVPASQPSPMPVMIAPSARNGQGNITPAASTSTAINASLSRPPNAGVFPTATLPGNLTIKNASTSGNVAYICWQGGACSASVGEPLAVGEGATESLPSQNMTSQPPTVFTLGAILTIKW